MNNQKLLTIYEAAKLLRVSEKTLRRWEANGRLTPTRTSGGHRRYTIEQLKLSKKPKLSKTAQTKEIQNLFNEQTTSTNNNNRLELNSVNNFISTQLVNNQDQTDSYVKNAEKSRELNELLKSLYSLPSINKKLFIFPIFTLLFFVLLTLTVKSTVFNSFKNYANRSLAHTSSSIDGTMAGIDQKVLAATSFNNINFIVNSPSKFNQDADFEGVINANGGSIESSANSFTLLTESNTITIGSSADNITIGSDQGTTTIQSNLVVNGDDNEISGTLNLTDGNLISDTDLTINPTGGGVKIGTGAQNLVDLNGSDLYVTGDLEIDGLSYISTLVINGDTFTDLTGSGLQVSSGSLQTTLGTSIDSSEISDDTIKEIDLNISNTATSGYALTYNSTTGGFTWTDISASLSNLWTDGGSITYLTSTTDDFALGGTNSSSPLYFDVSAGDLTISGNLAVNGDTITADGTTLTINAGGNVDIQDILNVNSITTDTGGVTITSGQDLTIGTIGLNDVGTSNTDSGASLIGVFDEFANSNSTNIQDVLDDLDSAMGAGASKWTDSGSLTYLTSTTDSITVGSSTELGKLAVDGDADEIQLVIQGNSTQTANLATFENSSGSDLMQINNYGDLLAGFTQLDGSTTTTAGSSTNALTVSSTTNFNVGNYVRIDNTTGSSSNCASGTAVCYAKITAVGVNSIQVNAGFTVDNGATISEYHLPEIGASNTAQTLTNRYGRGYFIAGVTTGNASTTLDDGQLFTSNVTGANSTSLSITTGSTTTSGNSGDITIDSGSAANTAGVINVGTTNASAVNIGRSGTTTTVGGSLSVNGQAFADLTGNGLDIISNSLTIDLTTATDNLSSTTSNGSGLEVLASGLTLLQGCSNGQILKWNESNDSWECGNDTGASFAIVNIENNDVAVGSNVDTVDFSTDFSVTASPSNEANVSIADDIINFTELNDSLTLDAATTITNSLSGDFAIDLTSTGDFVIKDNNSTVFTFTDGGALTQAGTGQITFTGNVDATNGLDVTNANLTIGGSYSITTAGVITAATDETINGIDVNGGAISDVTTLTTASGTSTPLSLVRTASGAWISMNDGTDSFGYYNNAGTPEGAITANTGSIAVDTTNGAIYVKLDDSDNTSWSQLATTSSNYGYWTLDGDDADTQQIDANNTVIIAGGTNGIDTDVSATDTITLNLDTTEIGTTTFGSGSGITWTFDASAGTDPTIAFGNGSITLSTATITGDTDLNGNLSVADTDIAFDGATTTFTTTGAFTLTPGGAVTLGDGGDTLAINSSDWDVSTTGTLTGISGITNDGVYTQTGVSQNTFTGNVDATNGLDVTNANLTVGGSYSFSTTGVITANTDETINGIDINTGAISDVTTLTTTSGTSTPVSLVRTASGQWIGMNDGTDTFGYYNNAGTPEGTVAANIGSIAVDTTNGALYVKTSDTANTGWSQLATTSSNYGYWILQDGDTTTEQIGSTETLQIAEGTGINVDYTTTGANPIITISNSGDTTSDTIADDGVIALTTETSGDYVAGLTEGTAIDISGTAGEGWSPTVTFDSTELGTTTWGSGSGITWTFDASGGTDTTLAFGDNSLAYTGTGLTLTNTTGITASSLSSITTAATLNLSGDLTVQGGDLTLGQGGTDGSLTIYNELGATDYSVIFQPSASQTQTTTYTLPVDDGTSNYVLTTNGSGVLSWQSVTGVGAGAGDITTVGDCLTGDCFSATAGNDGNTLYFEGTTSDGNEIALTGADSGSDIVVTIPAIAGTLASLSGTQTFDGAKTFSALASFTNSAGITIGLDDTTNTAGSLKLISAGANNFSTIFQTGTQTQDITYTLPLDDGTNNYVLSTNGSGVLSWQSVTGVGGGTGDVVGPSSATNNAIARFDSTSGKLIKNSGVIIDDSNGVSGLTDLTVGVADGNTINLDGDGSPTTDLVQIGSGDTSATDGVDALQLSYGVSAASGNIIDITPTYSDTTAGSTSETFNIIDVDAFTATQDAAGDTGLIRALNVGNLTQTETNGTITANAIKIGTGWDSILDYNGTTVINGSGQVVTTQLSGTLFSNSSDSNAGTNTIIQGDTLTISGGTNGIDTSLSNDTYTLNLDTTEIGTTTFGSGSAVTWTFDASAGTDPTIAFGNGTITLSTATVSGTTDLNGDLSIADTDIAFDGASTTFTTTGVFTLTPGGAVTLGDGGDTLAINSSDWDINTTGDVTGIGSITMDGRLDTAAHTNNTGLNLPTFAGAPSAVTGTAEGDIVYDTTNNNLYVYDGANFTQIGGGGYSGWTLDGDDATTETISSGDTVNIAGGTNGIDTDVSATDTITLNLDYTEISTATFGSGSGWTWTFDAGATDPYFTFGSNALTLGGAATITATDVTSFNCTDCIDFDDLADSMTLDAATTITNGLASGNDLSVDLTSTGDFVVKDANTTFWTFGDDKNITYNPLNTAGMTITSDLTSGNRTTDVLTITQPDDTTYSSTGNLLQLTNHDATSTEALLNILQDTGSASTAVSIARSDVGLFTGTGLDISGLAVTSGTSIKVDPTSLTSGNGISLGGTAGMTSSFSGNYIIANTALTNSSGSTLSESGNYLELARSITATGASSVVNITGDVATFSSACTASSSGVCNDSSNVLSLSQSYASSTGAVLDITNAGTGQGVLLTSSSTGDLMELDASGSGTTANGLLIQQTSSGTITDAIDVSDETITNAINVGANIVLGTNAAIDFSEFDVSATTGSVTINDSGDAGQLLVEGTNLDINSLDFVGAGTITTADNNALTLNVAGGNAAGEDLIITANNISLLATGALSLTPDAAVTTAIDLTDTDFTNGISLGDNNIIGTTAAIDFTNFDVDANGGVSYAARLDAPAHQNSSGLNLPTYAGIPSSVTGTAEGDIVYDTTNNNLYVYDGATFTQIGGGGYSGWTLDGDDADTEAIASGNTVLIAGGTNGIDTDVSATDTITLNLDYTEISTATFGTGSGWTWTFNAGTTDPYFTFADNGLTLGGAATITATDVTAFNCTDCLNFDDFADSLSVDAATDINLGANALSIDLDSTGDFSIRDVTTDIATFADSGAITFTPTAGTAFLTNLGAGSNVQVAATAAPTADLVSVTNADQGTTTNGVDGLSVTFVTGDGSNPTNNGVNLALTSGGTSATDVLNGINFGLTGTSGTERGINFSDNNFDTDINATTDLTIGIGGTNELTLTATNFSPSTAEGNSLGSATTEWEQIFVGDDNGLSLGLDQDWTLVYDEATDDRLELTTAGTSGMLISSAVATGTGLATNFDSLTTGTGLSLSVDALTSGTGVLVESAGSQTLTGDLFKINIGSGVTATGNLFNVTDNNSSLFKISESQITSALPHVFTATGDVSFSYDAIFSNQTSSQIESYGPFSIISGESFESNNLTLTTYNSGNIVLNPSGSSAGYVTIADADPTVIFDTATATDTDFWAGVVEDAGGDDDDSFQIGDGTTPGTNNFLTISTLGAFTLNAPAASTTALTITDTDYTNALSIGDNNITGTTATIDFTNFDVATTGAITTSTGTTTALSMTRSSAGQWLSMADGTDTFGVYNRAGSPESNIAADKGSIAFDTANGAVYIKTTDTANTGWSQLSTGGASPFTDGTGITYLTDTAEDFAIGGSTLASPFSVDESANTVRIGEGANSNGTLNMYASDGATGSIAYTTSDEWNFTGGGINLDSYLDLDSTSTTAFTLGDGSNTYFTFDGSTDASDTLFSITDASSGITSGTIFQVLGDSITTGTGMNLSFDALTSGTGVLVESTGSQTLTGDLFRINIGSGVTATGNLFNVTDNNTSLFKIGETQITASIPQQFTAAGDVAIAYDLVMSNQTASTIDSYGPLTVRAGETTESNNLTLKTYNSGDVVVDLPATGQLVVQGAIALDSQLTLTANSTTPSVAAGSHFITGNSTNPTLISNFTDGTAGQLLFIEFGDSVTDLDCTSSSLNCGSTDITGIASGDTAYFIYDGTNWNLIEYLDLTGADQSAGADLAEYFPSLQNLNAGEVVKVDPEHPEHVLKTDAAYENKVLGIVSTNPGQVLGNQDSGSFPIALAGRVPVKISNSSSPIIPGDYVTASTESGKAMKAQSSGKVIGQALEGWDPQSGKDSIIVFINNTYIHFAEVNNSGNINLGGNLSDGFFLEYADTNADITNIGTFAEVISAKLKTGLAEAANLFSPTIRTNTIEALDNDNIAIKVGNHNVFEGKLTVSNQNNEIVYSVDQNGNAIFAGSIDSNSLNTKDATVSGELRVAKIYADEVIATNAKFADLKANTETGITREEIEQMLEDANNTQNFLNQSQNWSIDFESGTGNLNEITLDNLFVTGSAAIDSLSVSNTISLGSDLIIQKITNTNGDTIANSIDTLNAPLSIQAAAAQPVSIMAGKFLIDTNGDVQIDGNLAVTGTITSSGINLKENSDNKVLSLIDTNNEINGFVTASGSAKLKDVSADTLKITADQTATSSSTLAGYTITNNSSAGRADLPANTSEVIIKNTKVTQNTLIYVTATTSTQNQNLYVKSQSNGEFIVGFDAPVNNDVKFNWWIVESVQD